MKKSAGILVYRRRGKKIGVLLVHPGGPFWKNKDENVWSIPKGEIEEGEGLLDNAVREFKEETGLEIDNKDFEKVFYLGEVKSQTKKIFVFALEKDFGDKLKVSSNLVEVEWPPKSGKKIKVPEVDKIGYFDIYSAFRKLVNYQKPILEGLKKTVKTVG